MKVYNPGDRYHRKISNQFFFFFKFYAVRSKRGRILIFVGNVTQSYKLSCCSSFVFDFSILFRLPLAMLWEGCRKKNIKEGDKIWAKLAKT